MKYYALLDPFTRTITLHATRTAIAEALTACRFVDTTVSFLKLDSDRYKAGRVKTIYRYPKEVRK